MDVAVAIKAMLWRNGKTQKWLSNEMGYNTISGIGNIIVRKNVTLDVLCEICNILGYEIILKRTDGDGSDEYDEILLEGRGYHKRKWNRKERKE